jgi:hypothetical protein
VIAVTVDAELGRKLDDARCLPSEILSAGYGIEQRRSGLQFGLVSH